MNPLSPNSTKKYNLALAEQLASLEQAAKKQKETYGKTASFIQLPSTTLPQPSSNTQQQDNLVVKKIQQLEIADQSEKAVQKVDEFAFPRFPLPQTVPSLFYDTSFSPQISNPFAEKLFNSSIAQKECTERALIFYKENKYQEAKQLFKAAWAMSGGQQDLFTTSRYAGTLRELGEYEEAEQLFKAAYAMPGGQQDLYTTSSYADTLTELGKYKKAETLFKAAYAMPRGQYDLFTTNGYADTLQKLGKYRQAETLFLKAYDIGGEQDISTNRGYAELLCTQRKFEEAQRACKKALAVPGGEEDLSTVNLYGEIFFRQKMWHEAGCQFKKALALPGGKEDLFTVSYYAATLFNQKEYREAAQECQKALTLPGGNTDPFTIGHYAATLLELGHLDQAAQECQKALALPNGKTNLLTLCPSVSVWRALGEYEKAEKALALICADPQVQRDWRYNDWYADILSKLNKNEAAAEQRREATLKRLAPLVVKNAEYCPYPEEPDAFHPPRPHSAKKKHKRW